MAGFSPACPMPLFASSSYSVISPVLLLSYNAAVLNCTNFFFLFYFISQICPMCSPLLGGTSISLIILVSLGGKSRQTRFMKCIDSFAAQL